MIEDEAHGLGVIDEILQVMYWMRGEHIAQSVTAVDLARMITTADAHRLGELLERLAGQGLVKSTGAGAYALTEAGISEGGRRFADEFAELTKPGHGECGDPDCDCHRTGSTDDCRHRVGRME